MEEQVRVRFAPSPTGLLHVGNARTALFNFLFARQMRGTYILRLEDTDAERSTAEAEKAILEDLRWLGLDWDEGPDQGPDRNGNFGPYRQSERLEVYRRYAQDILEKGQAYRCYCTPEELEEKRQRFLARGIPPKYDGRCRHLIPEEERSFIEAGRPASLRFWVQARRIDFEDLVKGRMSFDGHGIGDFTLLRSDGTATYNFAVVVDDALMQVTHVIRGEDHLTNTPRQILLYQTLGFTLPKFAHLSMILGPDRSPLSKRHGATSVAHFREEGILAEALANYLALLGWSAEDAQEIFSLEELARKFSLGRVSRSSAVFDAEKLKWVNRAHLKKITGRKALELAHPFLKKAGVATEQKSEEWLTSALEAVWGEVNTLSELAEPLKFLFDENWEPVPEVKKIFTQEQNRKVVQGLVQELQGVEEITQENYKRIISAVGKRVGLSGKNLYLPLRAALTGKTRGPELEKIFLLLGKKGVLRRADSILS